MKLIWTKSISPLSILIRRGTNSDCSHFALVFKSPAGGLTFQSNLLGTHPKYFKTAIKNGMEIVHEIDLPLSIVEEDAVWDEIVDAMDSRGYDYPAFFYLVWRVALWKFLNRPMPAKNAWARKGALNCVEVFEAIKKHTKLKDVELDTSMVLPHDLYARLSE